MFLLLSGRRSQVTVASPEAVRTAAHVVLDARFEQRSSGEKINGPEWTARDARDVMSRKDNSQPLHERKPISRAALQQRLTDAVKTGQPELEPFVGVVVERLAPTSPGSANWAIKGVKHGRADCGRSGAVLSHCLDEAQLEFEASD